MCEVNRSDLFADVDPRLTKLDPITTRLFYLMHVDFWRDVVLTLAGGTNRLVFPKREIDENAAVRYRFDLIQPSPADDQHKTALARAATTRSIMIR